MFRSNANWAFVKDRVMVFELRDAINEFVSCVKTFVGWVTKSLVPKESFSLSTNGIDVCGIRYNCISRKFSIIKRKGMELGKNVFMGTFLEHTDSVNISSIAVISELFVFEKS